MAAAIGRPLEFPDSRSSTPVQQERPTVHPVADVPPNRGDFFDPTAPGGEDFIRNPSTSVSQIFAIMRQWVPHTQKNMSLLINELVSRGCHVDDRDGLTDATLLHFACKSAAVGAGNPQVANELVKTLIAKGADVCAVCRWTGMQPLHYAAYFDAADIIDSLVATGRCDVNKALVEQFDDGTALHIAVANFAMDAVAKLLYHGSNPWLRNSEGCCALDCIPAEDSELFSVMRCVGRQHVAATLKQVLEDAMRCTSKPDDFNTTPGVLSTPAKREVKMGDRVLVNGRRYGTARYIGRVRFSPASLGCSRYPSTPADQIWVGVELEQATGENNGTVDGKEYFSCTARKGTFAPIGNVAVAKHDGVRSRDGVARSGSSVGSSSSSSSYRSVRKTSSSSVGSTPTSKLSTATAAHRRVSAVDAQEMRHFAKTGASQPDGGGGRKVSASSDFKAGDLVWVSGKKPGVVRFVGETEFAQGVWYGVQLDQADGKNDGSVGGHRYFSCKALHGIFAPLSKLTARSSPGSLGGNPSSSSFSHATSSSSALRSRGSTSGRMVAPATTTPTPSHAVDTGDVVDLMSCKVLVNSEMAVVKFIGEVEFADGVWLGVEMKGQTGKHDGSVKGRRYFTCKQDHGLMVRPQRATYRGISCAVMLAKQG